LSEIRIFWAEFDDFEIEFETPLYFSLFLLWRVDLWISGAEIEIIS